ncbi:TPA: hypothetical protein N0F65_007763 [Lagenidium giganteum]|uniref:Pre-mRNA-splicing factor SYF1 n=1 Tax=Lagenidium giganteum TaxID=4803 RepID=A0AAV2YPJ3_9STRA|nr:TPA: hypothetical protein N0F65_007763 [Lagenidium giganteum]
MASVAPQDTPFAEFDDEVARNPYSIHAWLNYLRAAQDAPLRVRAAIYERAVHALPRSYKLWQRYLTEARAHARGKRIDAPEQTQLVALYERALVQLNKMPRVWLDYVAVLRALHRLTACRHAFDRALRALPITQHARIWPEYLAFVKASGVWQTAVRVYRRYLQLEPTKREEFVTFLVSVEQYEEASTQLVLLINQQDVAATQKTAHALWMQLCDLITQHPEQVAADLDVDAILRSGIRRFSDEVGRLWCSLATYYVRLGMFEAARDVYEEAIKTVMTVRDFSMVFDAYIKFIEAMLSAEMELTEQADDEIADDGDHQLQVDRLLKIYEDVADRRPVLLNSVLLRQNPNNVREWEKRIELYKDNAAQVIRTYAEAVKTVHPMRATCGKLVTLWVKFAKLYENHRNLQNARAIFRKAIDVNYKSEEELATAYCEWAELELRHECFDEALDLVRRACVVPETVTLRLRKREHLNTKERVHKCVKLWTMRLDLEESLGDVESTRAAYDQTFELLITTPQMVVDYAAYLRENKFFEESFRVYERGLSLFPKFPHALELWQVYLTQFVARYGGKKIERARDLHEQAIKAAPAKYAKTFFLKYAELEEQHGMLRNVLHVLERATDGVLEEEKLEMYRLSIKKAHKYFGVARVREIYQRGITNLRDADVAPLCIQFAAMETKLGEIERARAIYAHASQFCDPRLQEAAFWKVWHDFEVAHGSEHSFLEMLRIKRSVEAQYSQVNYVTADVAAAAGTDGAASTNVAGMVPATSSAKPSGDAMANLEMDVTAAHNENDRGHENGTRKRKPSDDESADAPAAVRQKQIVEVQNDEEIDLDDEEEDDEDGNKDGDEAEPEIEQRELPATLFGSGNGRRLGAEERS